MLGPDPNSAIAAASNKLPTSTTAIPTTCRDRLGSVTGVSNGRGSSRGRSVRMTVAPSGVRNSDTSPTGTIGSLKASADRPRCCGMSTGIAIGAFAVTAASTGNASAVVVNVVFDSGSGITSAR
ncbi:MAG: hypothetical protein IIA67_07740 [Planctomycetes bacterium]|nr:hypothetical protein [Planctomycetota bacterium]